MKVLLVSSSSGSQGGGELFLSLLGRGLVDAGHEAVLWASDHPRMDALAQNFAPVGRVMRHPYRNTYDYRSRALAHWRSCLGGTARIEASWKAVAPDIVLVNKQNLEDGLDLLVAAERSRLPAVSVVHITQSAAYLKARNATLRDLTARHFLRRFPGRLVAVSRGNRRAELAAFTDRPERVIGIDNGVAVPSAGEIQTRRQEARAKLGLGPDDFLILGLGRLEEQKRPLRFLEMARKAQQISPRSKIWWVGAGRMEAEWDAAVRSLGMENAVARLGWKEDVIPYLAAADLFIHSAAFEGLPLGLLEALAWGLPALICEDLATELPADCRDACVVARDDSWVETLADPVRRATVSQRAAASAREHYSVERMVREYLNVYERQREDSLR